MLDCLVPASDINSHPWKTPALDRKNSDIGVTYEGVGEERLFPIFFHHFFPGELNADRARVVGNVAVGGFCNYGRDF